MNNQYESNQYYNSLYNENPPDCYVQSALGDVRPWTNIQVNSTIINTSVADVKTVEVLHVNDGLITIHDSMRAASRELDVTYSTVHSAILHDDGRVVGGRVYRFQSSTPWNINHDYKVKPISILAVKDGDSKEFTSLKSAARYFNCDRSKLKTHIRDSKHLNGWLLSYTNVSPNTQ